eukprot:m.106728 g.106728  ORF g.106728 m.106728 type:complete len:727 (+) comp15820_c0_seq10:110-2290(+)
MAEKGCWLGFLETRRQVQQQRTRAFATLTRTFKNRVVCSVKPEAQATMLRLHRSTVLLPLLAAVLLLSAPSLVHGQQIQSCQPLTTNGGFESGAVGFPVDGWTQVDILTAGDSDQVGIRAASASVKVIQGSRYLNAGRSSVFYQQMTASAVAGAIYNVTLFASASGSAAAKSRVYISTSVQTPSRSVPPATNFVVLSIPIDGTSAQSGIWYDFAARYTATAADAGKPLYINLESNHDNANAEALFDGVSGSICFPVTTTSTTTTTTSTTRTTTTTTKKPTTTSTTKRPTTTSTTKKPTTTTTTKRPTTTSTTKKPTTTTTVRPSLPFIRQFGSTGGDSLSRVAYDADGNIYATGQAGGSIQGQSLTGTVDAYIVKFNSTGGLLWLKLLGSAVATKSFGVAVDPTGNPVIAGYTDGALPGQTSAGEVDFFMAKFDKTSGSVLWINQFGTAGNDYLQSVAVSSSGAIYTAGYTAGSFNGTANKGGFDIFVAKLSSSGTLLWARMLSTSGMDIAYGVAFDSASNALYVAGYTGSSLEGQTYNGGSGDGFVTKFDTNGNKKWTTLLGTPSDDEAHDVAVSSTGHIYVAGYTTGSFPNTTNAGLVDAFLVKLSSNGAMVWAQMLGTASFGYAYGVAVDGAGNVYLSGTTRGNLGGQTSNGNDDVFVAKYNAAGTRLSVQLVGTSGPELLSGFVAVDASNHVVVGGNTQGSFPGFTNAGPTGQIDVFVAQLN